MGCFGDICNLINLQIFVYQRDTRRVEWGGIGITAFFHVYVNGSTLSIKWYLGCIKNLIIPFVSVEFWMFFGARPAQGTATTTADAIIVHNQLQ